MLSDISTFTNVILKTYFTSSYCIILINNLQNPLQIEEIPVILYSNESLLYFRDSERCDAFIISNDRSPLFTMNRVESYIREESQARYNRRKYLIFVTDEFDKTNDHVLDFVSDVLFINITSHESYELYTHKYIGKNDVNSLVFLDAWFVANRSFQHGSNLFPDKITDQHGRDFKIGAVNYIPYSCINGSLGSEMLFALEFAKKLNMTAIVMDAFTWGAIYANWTGSGALGGVLLDTFDIAVGALFALPFRIRFLDFSTATVYSRVTCLVPNPKIALGWLTPIKVFNVQIWLLFLVSFAGIIANTKFIKYIIKMKLKIAQNDFDSLFRAFAATINQPQHIVVPANLSVVKFTIVLIYIISFIFGVCYNSRLASVMIVPNYIEDINTVQDLAESKIKWGEEIIDWALPLEVDTREEHHKVFLKFVEASGEQLRILSVTNQLAFGIERLPSGNYAIGQYIKSDIIGNYKVMKDDLYHQYAAMPLRKNSILKPYLNQILLDCQAFGLLNYWESQATLLNTDSKIRNYLSNIRKPDLTVKLSFAHVKGAFGILGIGLTIASIYFILEVKYKMN